MRPDDSNSEPPPPGPLRVDRAALVVALLPLAVWLVMLGRRWTTPPPPREPRQFAWVPEGAPHLDGTVRPGREGPRWDPADRSTWPPQLVAAEPYLREAAGDPAGFEVVGWNEPFLNARYNINIPGTDETLLVTTREQDGAGGPVYKTTLVFLRRGKVVRVQDQTDSRSWGRLTHQ